ncbi:hypothetical protein VCRA2116O29_1080001 [Vibrio crassostreae]|nr:hypothetical protein VCRA2116O29_1080001 [Vibrio crassostreae]CAK2535729.1 hypothetical protein VCRA2119O48_660002 [Vibrio crassostreae]CAK3549835.1 hypothetical protein VCRA2123O74_1060002 [Vibrio crassostreae]CAK4017374.1 hypothetical protein VCRA212O16_730019 [Vibrio crassostreae]
MLMVLFGWLWCADFIPGMFNLYVIILLFLGVINPEIEGYLIPLCISENSNFLYSGFSIIAIKIVA